MWVHHFDFLRSRPRLTRRSNQKDGSPFKSGLGEISEFSCRQERKILDPNHVSVDTLSDTLFVKAFNRGGFLKDLTPKYQVLGSKPLIMKQNYQSVPKLIKNRRNRTKIGLCGTNISTPNLGIFLRKSKVDKWVS